MKHISEFRDQKISKELAEEIKNSVSADISIMEVCGTHTMAIFRSGIRSVLPKEISLISGPGCPVCVTAQNDIDAFIELAKINDVIITTFGDLIRVPGTFSSLQKENAKKNNIKIVYSTTDAIDIAIKNPDKKIVFLGVGFETTTPTVSAAILLAQQKKIENFFVYCTHKLVPPALAALLSNKEAKINGFLLPGHVSVIIGEKAYEPIFNKFLVPSIITGFEPTDILKSILLIIRQLESKDIKLVNAYKRAVNYDGNQKAKSMTDQVFEVVDANWRGIGVIPQSGLQIRDQYQMFDAKKAFDINVKNSVINKGCMCGQILTGIKKPYECKLYKTVCTPIDPVGPCMVSTEGTCAAYYKYYSD